MSTITTLNHGGLALAHHAPATSNGRVILIQPAMGVPSRFYGPYASFLAKQGFHVVTYDYRGMDAPAGAQARHLTLLDWADDQATALAWSRENINATVWLIIGHSLGGQMLGLFERVNEIHGFLGIAAQSGYWGHWRGRGRVMMWLLAHLIVPISGRLLGRLPAIFLGGGQDIPGCVARDWARALRHPRYIRGVYETSTRNHYDAVTCAMRLYCFADDDFAPQRAVAGLAALYPNAKAEIRHIAPRDVGLSAIGHVGFFRKQCERLWLETADWLAHI